MKCIGLLLLFLGTSTALACERGSIIDRIYCPTRVDTVLVIQPVRVDTVKVDSLVVDDQGFLEPPDGWWTDLIANSLRPNSDFQVTFRDEAGNERDGGLAHSNGVGTVLYTVPRQPWAYKLELVR